MEGQPFVRYRDCKECHGRGFVLVNPFLDRGAGSVENQEQCPSCVIAYDQHLAAGGERAPHVQR